MRILHVTYALPPGSHVADGITNVAYDVTKGLALRGHQVSVYTSNAYNLNGNRRISERELVNGRLHVRYLNYNLKWKAFFFTPSIMKLLAETIREFDIVHVHDARSFQGIAAFLSCARNKTPYVLQPHGSYLSPAFGDLKTRLLTMSLDRLISNRIVRNAASILTLTKSEAARYTEIGIPQERIALVPNGVNLSEYTDLPHEGAFKEKYGIGEDEKVILYLGRIHEIKGVDLLVKAYASMVRNSSVGGTRLVVVGPDDGYLGRLQALIRNLRMESDIMILGPLYGRKKLEAFVDASLFVLPSRYEAFPRALLEAYACCKPAIVSNVEGMRDLVSDGVTGLLVEPGNSNELASSICHLLENMDEARKMGLEGMEFVRSNFEIGKIVDRIEKIYMDILSG